MRILTLIVVAQRPQSTQDDAMGDVGAGRWYN
jgi:hypothetical protein